jgi:UPF0176 protein
VKSDYTIILFYRYIEIPDPQKLLEEQREICQRLNLKGRVIIAGEGINGTLEGKSEDIEEYIRLTIKDERLRNIDFKESEGTGEAFSKLSIKVRDEIVSGHFGELDVKPWEVTGKRIKPEGLRKLIKSGEDFYIVDMRNDFEQASGRFENSVLPGMSSYRDLPKVLPKLGSLKKKKVVTVCTGGVRCEKASGFLLKNGFGDVYQLEGGIVRYMEKYPNQDFKGSLYVFDNRLLWNADHLGGEHEILGKCESCGESSEHYINCKDDECHRHFILCGRCVSKTAGFCPGGCRVDRFGEAL